MSSQSYTVQDGIYNNGRWTCKCGESPVEKTSKRPHSNGRKFFRCPTENRFDQCGFYLWEEDKIAIELRVASRPAQLPTPPAMPPSPQTPQKIKEEPTTSSLPSPVSSPTAAVSTLARQSAISNGQYTEGRAELFAPTPRSRTITPLTPSSSTSISTASPSFLRSAAASPTPAGRHSDVSSLSTLTEPDTLASRILDYLASEKVALQPSTKDGLRRLIEADQTPSDPSYRGSIGDGDGGEESSRGFSVRLWKKPARR